MNRKLQWLAWLWLIAPLLLGQSLDARRILPDRYTETITEVVGGKVVNTLSETTDGGMRELLQTEWTPASGITVTKINGNEETITSTPDYSAKTVTTTSSKGWTQTADFNNQGLPIDIDLTGTGVTSASLTPTRRADGSVQSLTYNHGGKVYTAGFNQDGTLSALSTPRGDIFGGHSIVNGVETLTIDATTVVASADGTSVTTSGPNVIGRTETIDDVAGGYKKTFAPTAGAPTETYFNKAVAPTSKTYVDNTSESYGYSDELLASISLPRGGVITFDYSLDGAKDLTSINWPEMTSGPFTIAGTSTGFGYDLSGNVRSQTDPSGTRSVDYLNGRLSGTTYTAGLLNGYQILRALDGFGRHTGTTLNRDGQTIHSTATTPDGLSDQILDLASGAITATPQRDGAGNLTGYVWSDDGTNTVTQIWTRGPGGRIESAGSDVPGAPSFDYLIDPQTPEESFDSFGRRLKCQTAGGIWTYQYGASGQLTSAVHPTLGSFTYAFDGIGRRTDQGIENTTDLLNRTTAWTHDQQKTITINADPNARVWFNGVEVTGFSGTHQEVVTPPDPEGGWVPYDVLAVLENAGDGFGNPPANPLASPDAKAEQSGAVWVPPAAETLTYDAAGNRESSAQWDYGWNAKNQLARIRTKGHDTAPQAYDLTFAYDSEGRRVKKHVVELQNGSVVAEKTVLYLWDGWDLLYERHQLPSGLTTLERKYLWGPDIADGGAGGAGGLLLIQETKGDTTTEIIPLYDGTGHVVALTDIEKNLLATYAYGPFGEKIAASGPRAQNNPWRWATKYLDEETGLYYFGHRYFDPVTGQWLSREPLGESESVNLYVYAGNDPINHVDVLGLSAQKIDEISQQLGPFAFDNPDNLELLFELRRKLQDNDFRITQTRERLGLNNVGIFLGSDGAIVLGQDNTYLIDFAPRSYTTAPNAWNKAGMGGRIWMSITEDIPQYWQNAKRRHALDGAKSPLLGALIEHTPGFGSSYMATSHVDKGEYGWAAFNYILAGVDVAPFGFGASRASSFSFKSLAPDTFFGRRAASRLSDDVFEFVDDGLSTSIRKSFRDGEYKPWTATEDLILYRAQDGQGIGGFFGLERPFNSMDAEELFNIKLWGNNATHLLEYRIPAGSKGFIGAVEGGAGTQIFIPNARNLGFELLNEIPLFINELKFITP